MPETLLMSGNEAIARGAWEAGCRFGAGYPGTPSSEILPALTALGDCYTEWSVNEKCALEAASGASLTGARSIVTMKHVGLNVAADPFFTLSYTGVGGGLVVVSADDPAMHSSQNEQDNRQYARAAKVPMLEPCTAQEALEFTRLAFELSEQFDTPVLLRETTRLSHGDGIVTVGERGVGSGPCAPEKQAEKYVMIPARARQRRVVMAERTRKLREFSERTELNRREPGDPAIGIISSGMAYEYAKEVRPDASFLKLGFTWPLPERLIRGFAASVVKLYVIEELDLFLTEQIRALGVTVEPLPESLQLGELSPARVRAALQGADALAEVDASLPMRPPQLCAGCPHRGVFHILRKLKLFVAGDIGCYTLGTLPPLLALDTCLCMGAGVGQVHGINQACGGKQRAVAVIGDSTFVHSGVAPLIDMVWNRSQAVLIILDNQTTAMTGHQPTAASSATGSSADGTPEESAPLDLVRLCKAAGVKDVTVVDPYRLDRIFAALRQALAGDRPSVIITNRPCGLLATVQRQAPLAIDADLCQGCLQCAQLACPALVVEGEKGRIVQELCRGCTLCSQVCSFGAVALPRNAAADRRHPRGKKAGA